MNDFNWLDIVVIILYFIGITWGITPPREGHGGAGDKMKDLILKPNQPDQLNKRASSQAGIAACQSIETG